MRVPWSVAPALSREQWHRFRHRAIFDCDKWDPQVEDVSTIASQALILDAAEWKSVTSLAESLAAETIAAERELCERFDLHRNLGLPWSVRRVLRRTARAGSSARSATVIRFDFHATHDGWRISEANTDVPGGFIESSGMSSLMASYYPDLETLGDPAGELARAIAARANDGAIALVHACAYSDDRQVMAYFARRLSVIGAVAKLVSPDQLRWCHRQANFVESRSSPPAAAIVRFFPAEWLPNLGRDSGWPHYFSGGCTPQCNCATAILTQSKRLPLVWDRLNCAMSTWRRLLPETRDPRDASWDGSDEWLVKPALGRVGEGIAVYGMTDSTDWRKISREIRRHPESWVAQRRFGTLPVAVNDSFIFPCLGVFTVDGRVVGAYGRATPFQITDYLATDTPVLVRKNQPIPADGAI